MTLSRNLNPLNLPDFDGNGTIDQFVRSGNDNTIALLDRRGNVRQRSSLPSLPLSDGWTEPTLTDFNGDSTTDLFWRNDKTGESLVWLIEDGRVRTTGSLPNLGAAWAYQTGDFNGDQKGDLFWHNQVTEETRIWLIDGLEVLESATLSPVPRIWEARSQTLIVTAKVMCFGVTIRLEKMGSG
ncbi:MAG: VCBS repeat-containing protein [Leptolyngbyaceae cyanobacterium CSU_1_3]|nr:VCBS repeat-containing protein [Leptolyngbyaceae cyanobacterium CSU_1_3]